MNQTIRATVQRLAPEYSKRTDSEIIEVIKTGRYSGEALFYILFGRYHDMLHTLFKQEATSAMEFSDFMLELNMRLFNHECTAVNKFDEKKASFKTYLSRIAHNLLYDLRKKEKPTLECTEDVIDTTFGDVERMMQLIDAINSYTDGDARYVLFKVIEGYSSKELALMLSSRKHEDGTLAQDETLKPSYIDTIRSRALRNIRKKMMNDEDICYQRESMASCENANRQFIKHSIDIDRIEKMADTIRYKEKSEATSWEATQFQKEEAHVCKPRRVRERECVRHIREIPFLRNLRILLWESI